nr:anti-repressor SinI family protein [Peribacillus sp. Bi96]
MDVKKSNLDVQWLLLIMEAKEIGLTPKEIRCFLNSNSNNKDFIQLKKQN